jgi:hypothetical protein
MSKCKNINSSIIYYVLTITWISLVSVHPLSPSNLFVELPPLNLRPTHDIIEHWG